MGSRVPRSTSGVWKLTDESRVTCVAVTVTQLHECVTVTPMCYSYINVLQLQFTSERVTRTVILTACVEGMISLRWMVLPCR